MIRLTMSIGHQIDATKCNEGGDMPPSKKTDASAACQVSFSRDCPSVL